MRKVEKKTLTPICRLVWFDEFKMTMAVVRWATMSGFTERSWVQFLPTFTSFLAELSTLRIFSVLKHIHSIRTEGKTLTIIILIGAVVQMKILKQN